MKKISKIVSTIALSLALSLGAGVAAFAADGSVTFRDFDEVFVFLEGSEYTDTDLFGDLKGVMPGDSLRQVVSVENGHSNAVNIYLRADAHDEDNLPVYEGPSGDTSAAATVDTASMNGFLSQLTMKVYWEGEIIYQGSPDQTAGLTQNVLLGEFSPGESKDLTIEVSVPITMGNEYMNRVGEIDWVFVVEELDEALPGTDGEGPGLSRTGDDASVVLIAGLTGVALLVCVLAFVLSRRPRKKNQ